jgi:FkbM family methyltransferase
MLIFDIGANTGNFTQEFLSAYPDSSMILIEANDDLIPILKEKFLGNQNIVILNYLMSSINNQHINFYISDTNTISTASHDWMNLSRFSDTYRWNKVIKKETINLDRLIEIYGKPDLIKIDVEGYELEVIKGLSSKQLEICFEWVEEDYDKLNSIVKYLEYLGYNNFGFTYTDNHITRPNRYSCWNECFIHNDIIPERKEKWGMIWAY